MTELQRLAKKATNSLQEYKHPTLGKLTYRAESIGVRFWIKSKKNVV